MGLRADNSVKLLAYGGKSKRIMNGRWVQWPTNKETVIAVSCDLDYETLDYFLEKEKLPDTSFFFVIDATTSPCRSHDRRKKYRPLLANFNVFKKRPDLTVWETAVQLARLLWTDVIQAHVKCRYMHGADCPRFTEGCDGTNVVGTVKEFKTAPKLAPEEKEAAVGLVSLFDDNRPDVNLPSPPRPRAARSDKGGKAPRTILGGKAPRGEYIDCSQETEYEHSRSRSRSPSLPRARSLSHSRSPPRRLLSSTVTALVETVPEQSLAPAPSSPSPSSPVFDDRGHFDSSSPPTPLIWSAAQLAEFEDAPSPVYGPLHPATPPSAPLPPASPSPAVYDWDFARRHLHEVVDSGDTSHIHATLDWFFDTFN